jgi:CheY-like chemotaxis protein
MKKILLVDDDIKTMRSLVEDLQITYGFEVVHLGIIDNVIEVLNGSRFDIMILDIMMPIPSGWSFDEIRRSSEGISTGEVLYEKIRNTFPELPILIYSAKEVKPFIDKKTIILRKPELPSEIVNRINKLSGYEN